MEKQGGASLKVVGIAGPGDPLANPKTFETFDRVREAFPEMTLCLSTNGLRLPEMIEPILDHDVHSLTVTVNALTPETGARVYEWISYDGQQAGRGGSRGASCSTSSSKGFGWPRRPGCWSRSTMSTSPASTTTRPSSWRSRCVSWAPP